MANTTIILTNKETDWQVTKLKLDKFRAALRAKKIEHSYSEQTRWAWPPGKQAIVEYVWRYDFPKGIDFNFT